MLNTIYITGCDRGVGLEAARYFHLKGWNVSAMLKDSCQVPQGLLLSSRMLVTELNIKDNESLEKSVASTMSHFGGLDVLLNTEDFGLFDNIDYSQRVEEQCHRSMLELLMSTLMVTSAVVPIMENNKRGVIANVSLQNMRHWHVETRMQYSMKDMTDSMSIRLKDAGLALRYIELCDGAAKEKGHHITGANTLMIDAVKIYNVIKNAMQYFEPRVQAITS